MREVLINSITARHFIYLLFNYFEQPGTKTCPFAFFTSMIITASSSDPDNVIDSVMCLCVIMLV